MVNFTMLVRDRPKLTRQALDSLGPNYGMTVFVLNDRSDHETSDTVNDWCESAPHRCTIYCDKPYGTGVLRNTVIQQSEQVFGRGDYLYLSDNDVFFQEGWLKTLIHCYEDVWSRGFRVLGAYNHPYHHPAEAQFIHDDPDHRVHEINALALQSMLMRWDVWDKYGPFCDTPVDKVCQSEDVDFTNKIHADGFKIGVVSPALVVSTGITNTFGEKIPGWELVKAQCPEGVICE